MVQDLVQQNEVITMILALSVLVFMLCNLRRIEPKLHPGWLLAAFGFACSAWILTVFEGLYWPTILNVLEHICYAASSVLLAAWCWLVYVRKPVGSG